jgi:addiction module HigA family antidote
MHDPPHPGEVMRELCLEPAGLSVTAAARVLGVSRKALSELLNGHSGISPEMAVRLSKAFGGSIESWLTQQMHYDLARISRKAPTIEVKRYVPARGQRRLIAPLETRMV